ncbi:putative tellurium resistance membrane protein TerC [Lactobacillus colini]|uniref:Tellurium resistance membrane protein TerC n=1 Tax=Lactobacillus colini TaxID=1819254 RepID=A0ABS4MH41_9LACO|nr:hypothetical protein [Lactobacillus colini]MBP2059001.1 putative tellurium resistance membrane protein TerC [Lactobacillus colini]
MKHKRDKGLYVGLTGVIVLLVCLLLVISINYFINYYGDLFELLLQVFVEIFVSMMMIQIIWNNYTQREKIKPNRPKIRCQRHNKDN